MTSEPSKSPKKVLELPGETRAAPSPDDRLAAGLRGFGPLGILAILAIRLAGNIFAGNVVLPVGAVLVLVWARWSCTPWREIGYARPARLACAPLDEGTGGGGVNFALRTAHPLFAFTG